LFILFEIGDFNECKALSFIPQNFATEMALQRYDFLSITFYVSLKMFTFANKILQK
jgi:hypothetical protein